MRRQYSPGETVGGLVVDMDITTGGERTIAAHKPRTRKQYIFTIDPKENKVTETIAGMLTRSPEVKRNPKRWGKVQHIVKAYKKKR